MSNPPEHPESDPNLPVEEVGGDAHAPLQHEDHGGLPVDHGETAVHHGSHDQTPVDLHVAPKESHAIKVPLWKRWLGWGGSFFVISVLLHVLLLGGAAYFVVQVVEGRKEKLKFTAPPPSANPGAKSVEHKVKMAKKTASMSAPSISKRITSSAANASIALPAMEMNSGSGPDVMASVMGSVGAAGLGSGAGGGGAGMASMPMAGLTAFGFKGTNATGGLVGRFYDLKQTADGKPTNIKDDGVLKDPKLMEGLNGYKRWVLWASIWGDRNQHFKLTDSLINHSKVVSSFIDGNWDDRALKGYYQAKDQLTAYQWFIPNVGPADALKAFGVEKEVKPSHFVIHYKGTVVGPKDGTFRFVGRSGGVLAVRFNEENVFGTAVTPLLIPMTKFKFTEADPRYNNKTGYPHGKWFRVEAGRKYPMEILIDCAPWGFNAALMIEEKNPPTPYLKRMWNQLYPQDPPYLRFPVFALKKGMPIEPYVPPGTTVPEGANPATFRPSEKIPEVAPEPLIFAGSK